MTAVNSFAAVYMRHYRELWEQRLDALEAHLERGGRHA